MKVADFPVPDSLGSERSAYIEQVIDDRQGYLIQRNDLEPCALGTIGNLSYSVRNGGTPRAHFAAMLLSDACRSVADKWADMTSYANVESAPARARREVMLEVRGNSRLIGNLLGSLTAKVNETAQVVNGRDRVRIARELMALTLPSRGDLDSLKGAKYCLDTYLHELTESDLVALRYGVLSDQKYCEHVLSRISARPGDILYTQASRVLKNVARAVKQRFAHYAIHKPLSAVIDMLAANPVDGRALRNYLLVIPYNSGELRDYFKSLHMDEFVALLSVFRPENLDSIEHALAQIDDAYRDMSLSVLHSFSIDLDYEFNRRVPQGLYISERALSHALSAGNGILVSGALYRLSLAVEDTWQVCEVLSRSHVKAVRRLIQECMALFRDDLNNPVGPLNGHSLSKLDDDVRANLGGAASSLRRFGLELEPETY